MAGRRNRAPVTGNAFAQQHNRESLVPWESYQPVPASEWQSSVAPSGDSDQQIKVQKRPTLRQAQLSKHLLGQNRAFTDPLPSNPKHASSKERFDENQSWERRRGVNHDHDRTTGSSTGSSGVSTTAGSDSIEKSMSDIHPAFRASEGAPYTTDPVGETRQVKSTPVQYETLQPSVFVETPGGSHQEGPFQDAISSPPDYDSALGRHGSPRPDALILGNGQMSPTRDGTYGRVSTALAQPPSRIPSVTGVIESVENAEPSPSSIYSHGPQTPAPGVSQRSQPTFRHQLEAGLYGLGSRPASRTGETYIRSKSPKQSIDDQHSLPEPPSEYSNPAPPVHDYDMPLGSAILLQELFAEIHEQVKRSTNPIKNKLLSNHDDLIDLLTRKFDLSMSTASNGISKLNDKHNALESRLNCTETTNKVARERLAVQVSANHEEMKRLISSNSTTLHSRIENLIQASNTIVDHLQGLAAKMENLELRVEASQCRRCLDSDDARFDGRSSNNTIASPAVPEPLRPHAILAAKSPPTRSHPSVVRPPVAYPPNHSQTGYTPRAAHALHQRSQSSDGPAPSHSMESGASWYQQAVQYKENQESHGSSGGGGGR
ncbi:MAG: hypothetical protein M1837_004977 [Sclerophora amabilis]|nr:MAG: hypothetical protein M1837_004977 [Sclerophora amabilis]